MVIGARFADRYEILASLGSGGMAEVYLARDLRLGRQVALKVLHPAFARDGEFVERFRREAGAAARLNHPNVVHIYDCGETDGCHFIAMEYVAGRCLKEVILGEAPLPPARVVDLARQIVSALGFAHQAGIVHRDVKPQNVIVDAGERAKVTDFGIARAAGDGQITETGAVIGTALYLSPEQAVGSPATPASDLYSVGVVMYEMATGRPPFTGDNAVALGVLHVSQAPRPPRELVPDLPPALEAVILKALAKAPADRYGSAAELLAALDGPAAAGLSAAPAAAAAAAGVAVEKTTVRPRTEALGSTPSATSRPSGAPPVMTIADGRGHGQAAAQDGAGAQPPVAAPAAAVPSGGPQPVTRGAKERSGHRTRTLFIVAALVVLLGAAGGAAALVLDRVATVAVPDLVGKTMAEALESVSAEGLQLQEGGAPEASTEVAEGAIARQEPAYGGSMEKGRSVQVWLSAGPPPVPVPNLVGMTAEEAAEALRERELEATVVTESRADREAGRVFAQDPGAGREVKVGSVIEISVAVPPPTTTTTVPPTTTTTEPVDDRSTSDKIRDWFGDLFGGSDEDPSGPDATGDQ